jgi:cytochrome c peroxidase
MHDGSIETLEKVIAHYSQGGKKHPLQSSTIVPFDLSPKEQKQLISFLKSLTDTSYLKRFNFQ